MGLEFNFGEDEWGYYIDPETFFYYRINEDPVPESSFVVLKIKEFIEDIGRTVVNTSYGFIENDTFLTEDKRGLSERMSKACAEYILQNNTLPPRTSLKKEVKAGDSAYLLYNMTQYDQFHLKITDVYLEGQEPKAVIEELMVQSEESLFYEEKEREERYKVEYAKSGRSTCRECDEKIAKNAVRVGRPYYFQDHLSYRWYHEDCTLWNILDEEDVEGLEDLEKEDKKRIKSKL